MTINWLNALLLGNALFWSLVLFNQYVELIANAINHKDGKTLTLNGIIMILSWMILVAFWK